MTILYSIKDNNDKEIRIFGTDFVEKNKENCYLTINDKKQELCDYINKEEVPTA